MLLITSCLISVSTVLYWAADITECAGSWLYSQSPVVSWPGRGSGGQCTWSWPLAPGDCLAQPSFSGQCRCQHTDTSQLGSADCQHCIMSLTGGSQDLLENVWMWLLHVRGCTIVLCYVAINAMTEHISNETWSHSFKIFWNFHKIFLEFP